MFADNESKIIILGIGLISILMYWVQGNMQFGNLNRSSPTHALFALAQLISLMLYIYFVIFEIGFASSSLALWTQGLLLGIAGVIGVLN